LRFPFVFKTFASFGSIFSLFLLETTLVQVTEEDGVTEAKKMKSKDSNSFQTTCQHFSLNHWVAVAGESEWYIGQVVDVISSDNAVVNFYNNMLN
jgi:hypothetical protein